MLPEASCAASYLTTNGLVINNLYITGNGGGERGVRGKVQAFDINTGNLQWVMYSMGPDNEVGITPAYRAFYPDNQTSLSTWYGDSWRRGGGTVWGYFTWDPDTNIFYYSTGNCGPWNPDYRREWGVVTLDENGGMIDYRNNFCASQMARDGDTGELIWAYNITPADPWDFDEPLITPLVDLDMGQGMRQAAIKAARSGTFYVWDRNTGEIINEPWHFRWVTIDHGVDLATGRLMYNIDTWQFTHVEDRRRYTQADPGRRADGTLVADYTGTETVLCPGGTQGRNWHNDAYSPRTGLLYTSVNLTCQMMVVIEGEYVRGQGYSLNRRFNTDIPRTDDAGNLTPFTGELQANDPVAGHHAWQVGFTSSNQLPIMATATDLLFMGGNDAGEMRGLNAITGETVWTFRTGSRFNMTPITYLHDGRQYLAIIASSAATNGAVAVTARPDDANRYRRSGSTLYVWSLPETVAAN